MLSFFVLSFLLLGGCASKPVSGTGLSVDDGQNDPYENLNRKIFGFNDFVDRWLLKPVAKGYQWITPGFVDRGVSNFFDNIADVPGLINAGLQGDMRQAAVSTGRVLVNSTVGIGGLIDVATRMDLERRPEDFGQTLAVWGVAEGPYVQLPLLGGRNLRDAFAIIPDTFLNPLYYVDDPAVRGGLTALDIVDTRADLIALETFVAGDRYSFLRDVYRQQRISQVLNGEQAEEEGGFDDAFGDEDF